MSEASSEAEKIRNKRLAKLGTTPSAPAAGSSSQAESSRELPKSKPDERSGLVSPTKISDSGVSNSSIAPSSALVDAGDRGRAGSKASAGSTPSLAQTITPQKRESSSHGQSQSRLREPLDTWADRTLSSIFRITLQPGNQHDSHGHPLLYLPGVREELQGQGSELKFSTSNLDQAMVEAASNAKGRTPLEYLLACWKRISRQFRNAKSGTTDDAKYEVLKEARRLCMSYCIFAATIPEMFGWEPPIAHPLAPHLLVDPEDDRGLCHDFLSEAVSRFSEDDTAKQALVGAVEELSSQLANLTMNDDYKPYVLALRNFVRFPALVNAITDSSLFLPENIAAPDLEKSSLLGPFFRISPLQGAVESMYFSSPKTRDKGSITNSQQALRLSLKAHQNDLLDVVNLILRTSKDSRDKLLDWFALGVNLNHKRRAMQVDIKTVSSDGFMINLTSCLDHLCDPFMDATFSKIDRIDVEYLRRNPRVSIKEETKLNADQHTSDEFYSETAEGASNFISEVFFLTLAAHHYGTQAANSQLEQLEKDLKYMEKQLVQIEADRAKFMNAGAHQARMYEAAVKKFKDRIDQGLCHKYAVQGVLLDDQSQALSMQFMRYVIVWLLRLVDPRHAYPTQRLELPLPEDQSLVFKCLPEYFLEDVVGSFKFIMRNMPQIITSTQSEELVTICITFLRSSEYIKNPYLKSGLVTIMFHGIWPSWNRTKGVLGDLLNSAPFATQNLLHALLKFYIEAESTGTHTQFYDKFNIRYEIFQIIKNIWSNPVYREHLNTESRVNVEFFVRFVNLLLNDVTYVLDESFNAFTKINSLQKELHEGAGLDPTVRAEKEEALSTAQNQAKSYMQLTNETVAMLKLFTEALADAFTMPEIVQRLADMLDYNLDTMVGPKQSNLRVADAEEYAFRPKLLLSEIVDVYLNLRHKENFQLAIARDGRSYKPETFEKASTILRKTSLKSADELVAWKQLSAAIQKAKEIDDQAEEDLGEIPDEFLDPLMYTLMEDPVILPTSRVSIDRSTIRSHLLSDPNDPFNRSPLKIEDVVPDTELKAKIQAFKAEKRGKKGLVGEQMDTSSG